MPPAVVEKFAFTPWQTVWSAGVLAVVFSCTVKVALFVAVPQVPLTVTETECEPALNEPVETVMLALLPSNAEPSTVHA